MRGIIHIKSGSYLFRDDHGYSPIIFAWDIHAPIENDRVVCSKWGKLPKRYIAEFFNIDNPPQTVSYQPLLGDM